MSEIERTCGVCDHEIARHDPADGTCDAHATQGFSVCPCGRSVTVDNYRGAVSALEQARAALHKLCLERGSTDGYGAVFSQINAAIGGQ